MGDLIVATGDVVQFEPTFGNRTLVAPAQAILSGTGRFTINGRPGCVIADLMEVEIPGVPYISAAFSTPGMGVIQLVTAATDQIAKKVLSGAPVLIKGGPCHAVFIPTAPAINPAGAIPDPSVGVPTQGRGRIIVTQFSVRGN
ncbi:hypothetical protein DF039_34675 [Burkholderia cenocepacia]|nr:hypothetical protein DF039_34675 [Burkholderia cenocepacia]